MHVIFGGTMDNYISMERLQNVESKYIKILEIYRFGQRAQDFELETIYISFAQFPTSVLSVTSKQTALYRSALDRLVCRAFWIFLLVSKKIGSKVGQQEIFHFASCKEVPQEKYWCTLLCTNISQSFRPNFVKIQQIYIPY